MVQAKVDNPVGQAMRQLILVTYGPVPVLRDTLQGVSTLRVPLFMARGLAVVLGWLVTCRTILMCWLWPPSRQKLYEAIDDAEQKLGYEVNVKRHLS